MDDAQKRRQMMLKGTSRPNLKENSSELDMRSTSLLTSLEQQNCPTTWIANSGANGNPIIAIFPRNLPDTEELN